MNLLRLSLSSALVAGLALSGSLLIAQEQNTSPEPSQTQPEQTPSEHPQYNHKARHHQGKWSAENRLERMTKRYNLTEDQQGQIKPLLENEQQQMQSLKADTSTPKAEKHSKMESIRSDTNSKIESVLNDQQKQKFQADQERMQARMEHHHARRHGATSDTGTNGSETNGANPENGGTTAPPQ